MKHLFLTLLAVVAAVFNMNAVDTVYFAGGDNSWNQTSTPLTSTGDNIWTLTTTITQEFKLIEVTDNTQNWIGANNSSTTINLATTYQGWDGGGKGNITPADDIKNAGEVTITYNSSLRTILISAASPTPYSSVYFYGSINGSWSSDNQFALKSQGDEKSFTGKIYLSKTSHFRIIADGVEFGHSSGDSDVVLSSGESAEIIKYTGNNKAFEIAAGIYDVVLTLEPSATTGTLTFTKAYPDFVYAVIGGEEKLMTKMSGAPSQANAKTASQDYTAYYELDNVALTAGETYYFASKASADDTEYFQTYGAEEADTNLDGSSSIATATITEGVTNAFKATTEGAYKLTLDLLGSETYVAPQGTLTGVESVEVDADATVNVYNFAGAIVRQGVKASVATVGLPAGLYIAGGKKIIVK